MEEEGSWQQQDTDEAAFTQCMARASEVADRESGDRFGGGARWLRFFARSLFRTLVSGDVPMPVGPSPALEEWKRRRGKGAR